MSKDMHSWGQPNPETRERAFLARVEAWANYRRGATKYHADAQRAAQHDASTCEHDAGTLVQLEAHNAYWCNWCGMVLRTDDPAIKGFSR